MTQTTTTTPTPTRYPKASYDQVVEAAAQRYYVYFFINPERSFPKTSKKTGKPYEQRMQTLTFYVQCYPENASAAGQLAAVRGKFEKTYWGGEEIDALMNSSIVEYAAESGRREDENYHYPRGWVWVSGLKENFYTNRDGNEDFTIRADGVDFSQWDGLPPELDETLNLTYEAQEDHQEGEKKGGEDGNENEDEDENPPF